MSGELSIQLRFFNTKRLKPHKKILIFGPSGSGKSVLMRDLLYHINQEKEKFDIGFALCGSKEAEEALKQQIPSFLIMEYSYEKWASKWNSIKKLEPLIVQHAKKKGYNCLIVLDDCTFDKKLAKGKEFRELFMNGRHCKVTPVVCMQYCMDMGPDIRGNIDFVFVTKQTKLDILQKIHKYFFGGTIKDFKKFCSILEACTKNYEVLVLDTTVRDSSRIEDCIFYYKAKTDLPDFKLFSERVWKMNESVEKQKKMKEINENNNSNENTEKEVRPTIPTRLVPAKITHEDVKEIMFR